MEHLYAVMLQWTYAHGLHGVFAFMLGESAGLPLPTQLGFITAQGMLDARLCHWWDVFAWVCGGHLVGAALSYHLGQASDTALSRYVAHRRDVVAVQEQMARWYGKYGPLAILFGRLIGQVRPWSSFVAGLSRVPALTFYLWTLIGTLAYSAIAMWITDVGYKYWQNNRHMGLPIIVGMLVVFYGLPAYKGITVLVRRMRKRA
jgi:membrane protein DedA with SNARE-associated domain